MSLDMNVEYYVCHTNWKGPISIATPSGHCFLPAFRWSELLQMSLAVSQSHRGTFSPAAVLFLFLPATWLSPDDDLDQVRQQLSDAWNDLHMAPPIQAEPLEYLLLSCQSDVRWEPDDQFGWVCDEEHSRRNPNGPAALSEQEFRRLSKFLKAIAGWRVGQ